MNEHNKIMTKEEQFQWNSSLAYTLLIWYHTLVNMNMNIVYEIFDAFCYNGCVQAYDDFPVQEQLMPP